MSPPPTHPHALHYGPESGHAPHSSRVRSSRALASAVRRREREALFRQLEEEAEAYEAQLGKMAAQRSVSALGELHAEAAPGR